MASRLLSQACYCKATQAALLPTAYIVMDPCHMISDLFPHMSRTQQASSTGALPIDYFESPYHFKHRNGAVKLQAIVAAGEEREAEEQDSWLSKYSAIVGRAWYTGHIFIMLSTIASVLLCITRQVLKPWPRFFYRFTFVQIVAVYYVSLLGSLKGSKPGFFAMLPLPTFQYILDALISIVTVPHTVKLFPFLLLSLLHVADTHSAHHSQVQWLKTVSDFLNNKVSPEAVRINAYLNMWLFVELLFDCILVRPGAVIAMGFYLFLFRVRMIYSIVSQQAVQEVIEYVNDVMHRPNIPTRARDLWIRIRNKFAWMDIGESPLYAKDTEKTIDMANLLGLNYTSI